MFQMTLNLVFFTSVLEHWLIKITENMFVFIISVVFQIYCKTGKIMAIENFRLRLLKANLNYLSFYIIKKILKQFRCYLEKKIVAGGIIYYSDLTNIEYFCIFWWDSMFGKDSIGKYVYVEEISRCHFLDRNYSFCYSLQDYKSKLIKYFLE